MKRIFKLGVALFSFLAFTGCAHAQQAHVWIFGDSQSYDPAAILESWNFPPQKYHNWAVNGSSTADFTSRVNEAIASGVIPDIVLIGYTGTAQALLGCLGVQPRVTPESAQQFPLDLEPGILALKGVNPFVQIYLARGVEGFVPNALPSACFAKDQAIGWAAIKSYFPQFPVIYYHIPGFDSEMWDDAIHPSAEGDMAIAITIFMRLRP